MAQMKQAIIDEILNSQEPDRMDFQVLARESAKKETERLMPDAEWNVFYIKRVMWYD
ncbi:MAG: hypothetical protein ACLR1R_11115 [Ruminococcus callidus]